ncbi:hypothetical protein G7Y41_09750 [Schaalia sp. ZJ405]|uniref:hypothetical protein n=1 Tax=Schaalia sp. ZJ405 TaxID=2709403 RepID=UPI0013EBBE0E|nr:hypothetical protein [Schaalia sp. ZJ405]QPK81281.1 hypothetical protein G7Y41_09750 [Schaalia sp. ZJ405]
MRKRSIEEILDEIENANNGEGPDPVGPVVLGRGLSALVHALEKEAEAQEEIREAVALARSDGATWEMIGDFMGMTRAGAYKRFSSKIDEDIA